MSRRQIERLVDRYVEMDLPGFRTRIGAPQHTDSVRKLELSTKRL